MIFHIVMVVVGFTIGYTLSKINNGRITFSIGKKGLTIFKGGNK